ncbi:MAG: transketolase C-terminal domain-containing protein, partial [Deltaproteobacteria bacterium]
VLVLTRQKLPILDPQKYPIAEGVSRGGYIMADADNGHPDIVLIATGSEVHLILSAREVLANQGIKARAVSMPSLELFDEQSTEYKRHTLPPDIAKLSVEAGSPKGWREYVGDTGDVIGLNRFGVSAPGNTVMEMLGFNVENVVKRAMALVRR